MFIPLSDLRGQCGGHAYTPNRLRLQLTEHLLSRTPAVSSDDVQAQCELHADPFQRTR